MATTATGTRDCSVEHATTRKNQIAGSSDIVISALGISSLGFGLDLASTFLREATMRRNYNTLMTILKTNGCEILLAALISSFLDMPIGPRVAIMRGSIGV